MKERLVLVVLASILCIKTAIAQDIKLLFVGDVTFISPINDLLTNKKDILEPMNGFIKDHHLVIGNLEANVGNIGKPIENKVFCFQARPDVIPFLKKYFTAVSVANNHSCDYGKKAFIQMISLLDEKKLPFFGGGASIEAAHKPLILKVNDTRFAFIGFNLFFPRSFEAIGTHPGIAWGDTDQIIQDIKLAKKQANFVIIYPHWGVEYQKEPTIKQILLAHQLIDAGADAIIGSHPHVTQSIEIYKGKPIFYSLGNFIFPGFTEKDCNTGWALQLSVINNSLNWKVYEVLINEQGIPHLSGNVISNPPKNTKTKP